VLNSMRRAAARFWATAKLMRHCRCARELALRITETQKTLDEKTRKAEALQSELATEQSSWLPTQGGTADPVEGRLWTVQTPGNWRLVFACRGSS
jgi:hypothetical protein